MADISRVKRLILEEQYPFFSDEDIKFYIDENDGDVNRAIYQMLILKSESSTLSVSGLSTTDTSSYFKRLAVKYRPNNSGKLKGG